MTQEQDLEQQKREQGALERMVAELNAEHDDSIKREGLLPKIKEYVEYFRDNEEDIKRAIVEADMAWTPPDPECAKILNELNDKFVELSAFAEEYIHTPRLLWNMIEFTSATNFVTQLERVYPDLASMTSEDEFLMAGAFSYDVRIKGTTTASGETKYVLHNKGIDKATERLSPEGALQEIHDPLWAWESFRIHDIMREVVDGEPKYYYRYTYNGDVYANKTLEQMRDEMYITAGRSMGVAKQIFGPLVLEYCKQYIPKIAEYESRCGFTRDRGWVLPDAYHIRFLRGQQSKCRAGLTRMSKMLIHEHEAREMMKELYDGVSIRYKDVLFAWGAIAPFMHALVDHTGIMPIMSLGSIIGTTGKTPAAELVTSLIWDNIPHKYISTDEFNSEARAQQYLSTSTFPICVDECADLSDRLTQLIKSHATGEQDYSRLTQKSTLAFDRPLTSPIILTWNTRPILMEDYNFLARVIHVPVDEMPTTSDRERFIQARAGVTRGYLGKYIYTKTAAWTVEDIIPRLERYQWLEAPTPRAGVIYKLIRLGGEFFKEWFGITLDHKHVQKLILETMAMHGTDLRANIISQFVDGRDDKLVKVWDADTKCYMELPDFKPLRKWITTPVQAVCTRVHDGYIYTQDNLTDLERRTGMKGLALKTLHETVKQMYPRSQYKPLRHEGQTLTVIYVPRDDIFPPDMRGKQPAMLVDPPEGPWVDFVSRDRVEGPPYEVYKSVEALYRESGYKPVHLNDIKDRVAFAGVGEADVVGILAVLRDNSWIELTNDGYKVLRNILSREGL